MPALVTSSPSGSDDEARELARRFNLLFEPRRDRLVDQLLIASGGEPVLLLGALSADLYTRVANVTIASQRASLGMALLRLARAAASTEAPTPINSTLPTPINSALPTPINSALPTADTLVRAANLRPGDRVIDATLGLGADALIAAQATRARVLAFEKSGVLAAFTQAALRRPGGGPELRKAALDAGERIDIQVGDHLELLKRQPDRSAEVVLFDPMFRSQVLSQPVFQVVRAHAERAPLSLEAIAQARRVATRGVLIKDSPRGAELKRLGIETVYARRFLYGWLDVPRH